MTALTATDLSADDFERSLERGLQTLSPVMPAAVTRARHGMSGVLAGLRSSEFPEITCRFSRLTADRFPLELSFSTAQPDSLRYTSEIAGPEVGDAYRLPTALRLLEDLGQPILRPEQLALRELQREPPRRFGAWVGGRHDAHADSYKIYTEVVANRDPDERTSIVDRLFGHDVLHEPLTSSLRIVGFQPHPGNAIEAYCRIGHPTFAIDTALEPYTSPDERRQLREAVASVRGDRLITRKDITFGVSVAVHRSTAQRVVTLYAPARDLIGPDDNVVNAVYRWLAHEGLELPGYRALTQSGNPWPSGPPAHGLIGFSLVRGAVHLHIGLRTPRMG
jgi:hypothetical protein